MGLEDVEPTKNRGWARLQDWLVPPAIVVTLLAMSLTPVVWLFSDLMWWEKAWVTGLLDGLAVLLLAALWGVTLRLRATREF